MQAKLSFLFALFISCFFQADASWAERVLSRLTLEQKVGQLFMVGVASHIPAEHVGKAYMQGHHVDQDEIEALVRTHHVGGIIFFTMSVNQQAITVNRLQNMSDLPLLIGQDCEWGLGLRLSDGMEFPKNMTLGAIADNRWLYEFGQELGRQCLAVGVHVAFAPVVDINSNPKNPIIGTRSFGDDKDRVAAKGVAVMRGLQSSGVLACAKHFPGHGDTDFDSHYKLPRVTHSRERLQAVELHPFKELIDAGVESVMSAHLLVPELGARDVPATLSSAIITDLLRGQMGFEGLVFTDAMSMGAITKLFGQKEAALKAIIAGCDIILVPVDVVDTIPYIVSAVRGGRFSEGDLDTHVLKILQAKERLGLHEDRLIDVDKAIQKTHQEPAKQLKKDLYQQAITVIRNDENVVPLEKHEDTRTMIVDVAPGDDESDNAFVPLDSNEEQRQRIIDTLRDYDTVVLRIFKLSKTQSRFGKITDIDAGIQNFLDTLHHLNKTVVMVLCTTPYALRLLPPYPTIVAYEADAALAAMNVLWGDVRATGTLPIRL